MDNINLDELELSIKLGKLLEDSRWESYKYDIVNINFNKQKKGNTYE